ncbi:MarC family protein [Thiorhodovibrio frisius]|uniref:UPF0056 membrane protein n=1 Tax=Thiorhodovibrio frisius TaxID=631362 RepID=H8Z6Q1_9GAMM|nr:MarC family protein [Thiorhodovibrio frisius]EIC20767.1 multiple antibiotic transporter [Thiorhodovibrio frisius]WPL21515.1 inner membrane protein [Thiorhodovibrio frisius]
MDQLQALLAPALSLTTFTDHLQAIVTVLSVVNPAICGLMLAQVEAAQSQPRPLADATRTALVILIILVLAALFGMRLLQLFGVSLNAFLVAGGGVLAWMGFSMLSSGGAASSSTAPATKTGAKVSLAPVILFAASPGTITAVISIAVSHTPSAFPITALIAVAVATLIAWLTMWLFARFGASKGNSFGRDMVTRMMGLIVLAMGVQFALTGFFAFKTAG